MNKAKINYYVDFLLLLAFIGTAKTGLFLFFFMPSGVRQSGRQVFMGIAKSTWVDIHNWLGIAMVVAVIVHYLLHWDWLVCMTKSLFAKKIKNNDVCEK